MPYCPTCLEPFQSQGLFDKHRVGRYEPMERRCLTPDEMRAKGWRHDGKTWRGAPPKDAGIVSRFRGGAS
jgi:hypothetical protein